MTSATSRRIAPLFAAALLAAVSACGPDGPPQYADIRDEMDPSIRAAADSASPEKQAIVARFAHAMEQDADSIPGLASFRSASPDEVENRIGALTERGLTVLSDAEMTDYIRVMNSALGIASEQECAALGSSKMSQEGTWRLLMRLPATELDAYMRVIQAAIRHGARGDKVAPVADADARTEKMFMAWPEADLQRFVAWSENQATAPAAETCWSVRRLFRGLGDLSEAERGVLARHIISQGANQ